MVSGDRRTNISFAISAGVGTQRIDHKLICSDVLAVGSAPVSCAQCAHGILIADRMTVNGIERIGHIQLPAAAIAASSIRAINTVALQNICQI